MSYARSFVVASFLFAWGGVTSHVAAAWPDDPTTNLPIALEAGEQVQAKIVATPDGGAYVSWFGGSGYDVFLQRIEANGDLAWSEPLLVADRGFSSTQDYGLSIDVEGHALLAFRDDRFGAVQVTAARVAPDGSLDWGVEGVQVTNDGSFKGAPKVAGASDGGIYVAWTHDTLTRIARLNSAGNVQWTDTLSDPTGQSFAPCDLQASDAPGETGEVIVLIVRQGSFIVPRHLYAQKYNAAGDRLWGKVATPFFTSASLQFGNFPTFVSDGAGGGVFAWYSTSPLQSYVQHLNADGVAQLPANGLPVSTNGALVRVSPSAAYDAATGSIYAFWVEQNSLQSMYGVFGQRIQNGMRQWGDHGAQIAPVGGQELSQVRAEVYDNGKPAVFFARAFAFNNQILEAVGVSTGGAIEWSTEASTVASGKSRLASTISNGQAILVWTDTRNDSGDLYAQNVRADGSLGDAMQALVGDLNGDGVVNGADLATLLANWGACPQPQNCPADLSDDGVVNGADLATLLANWTGG